MAGYTEPRIFRMSEQDEFGKFVAGLLDDPFHVHVRREMLRLAPIFQAAGSVLTPYAKTPEEQQAVQAENIAKIFQGMSLINASMMFGMPLILEEGFGKIWPESHNTPAALAAAIQKHAPHIRITGIYAFEPGGGARTTNRMFNTARFGFIGVQYRAQGQHRHGLTFPYLMAPSQVLAAEEAKPLLKQAAVLSSWINHDWFHTMMYPTVGVRITQTSEEAPLHRLAFIPKLRHAWYNNAMRNYRVARVESWALRFAREIFDRMVQSEDNPLSRAVRGYLQAFRESGIALQAETMAGLNISLPEYLMRMLAFHTIRAAPLNHEFTQAVLQESKALCAGPSQNPQANAADLAFDKIYKSRYAGVLFGNYLCNTAQDYTDAVLDLTAEAITLAKQDIEAVAKMMEIKSRHTALYDAEEFSPICRAVGQRLPEPGFFGRIAARLFPEYAR